MATAPALLPHKQDFAKLGRNRNQECLNQPGASIIQLKVKYTSAEELEKFPTRITKEDACESFGWCQAWQAFKEQNGSQGPPYASLSEAEVLEVDLGCSQETLALVVSFVYSEGIQVSTETAAELLTVGDYLMADWLTNAVRDWLLDSVLPITPHFVFTTGRRCPNFGLIEAATMWISASCPFDSLRPVERLIDRVAEYLYEEQSLVLATMAQILTLRQIIQAFSSRQDCWGFGPRHLRVLMEAFPESRDLFDLLLGEDTSTGSASVKSRKVDGVLTQPDVAGASEHITMWMKMAGMVLAAREQSVGMTWKLLVRHLHYHQQNAADTPKKFNAPRACGSPAYDLGGGRRFRMRVAFKEGDMAMYVQPLQGTFWREDDAFKVSAQSPETALGINTAESWPKSDEDEFGKLRSQWRGSSTQLSSWLENSNNTVVRGTETILAVKLEQDSRKEYYRLLVREMNKVMSELEDARALFRALSDGEESDGDDSDEDESEKDDSDGSLNGDAPDGA